jgi:hypothetical protein
MRTFCIALLFLAYPANVSAQICRSVRVGNYSSAPIYSSYASAYTSYVAPTYYTPTYTYQQVVAVPVALAVEVVPQSYYSVSPQYSQSLLEKAQSDREVRLLGGIESLLKTNNALTASDRSQVFDLIRKGASVPAQPPFIPQPKDVQPVPQPQPQGPQKGAQAAPSIQNSLAAFRSTADAKCMKCHNASTAKGNLDLTDLSRLTELQLAKMFNRCVIEAPNWTMPLNSAKLTDAELGPLAEIQVALTTKASP